MARADVRWDWDGFYRDHRPPRVQVEAGRRNAARLERFIESKGLSVRSLADVGCGPATTLFELAPRLPGTEFLGFDLSGTILEKNRRKARRNGLSNLTFRRARLPQMPTSRRFDIVICIATLHYVRDSRRAIRNLFAMTAPGGHLVFNYPNRAQRAATAREAERDPLVRPRFHLVLEGRNLLSGKIIAATLGREPRNFWTAVGDPPRPVNPCVVVSRRR